MDTKVSTEVFQKVIELLIAPLALGLVAGVLSSCMVSRWYRKKSLLDECSRQVRRLCPYRRENIREGDGLEETSWGLKIQSEIFAQARYVHEAQVIKALSEEMEKMATINGPEDKLMRDARKDAWKSAIARLY